MLTLQHSGYCSGLGVSRLQIPNLCYRPLRCYNASATAHATPVHMQLVLLSQQIAAGGQSLHMLWPLHHDAAGIKPSHLQTDMPRSCKQIAYNPMFSEDFMGACSRRHAVAVIQCVELPGTVVISLQTS